MIFKDLRSGFRSCLCPRETMPQINHFGSDHMKDLRCLWWQLHKCFRRKSAEGVWRLRVWTVWEQQGAAGRGDG